MNFYCDNDFLQKLVRLGLWDEFLRAHDYPSVFTLRASRYRYKQAKRRKNLGEKTCDQILAAIDATKTVPEVSQLLLNKMCGVDGLDEGEALLFGAAYTDPGSFVLTGDKKAIKALAAAEALASVCSGLGGRVYCLELAMAMLLGHLGLRRVCDSVCSNPGVDKTLEMIFPRKDIAEAPVTEAFDSFLKDLKREANGLLGYPPRADSIPPDARLAPRLSKSTRRRSPPSP